MIRIKLFGIARDIIGGSTLEVDNNIGNVADLLEFLRSEYPAFSKLSSLLVAVNEEYAEMDKQLTVNDEVALIPPVSGG